MGSTSAGVFNDSQRRLLKIGLFGGPTIPREVLGRVGGGGTFDFPLTCSFGYVQSAHCCGSGVSSRIGCLVIGKVKLGSQRFKRVNCLLVVSSRARGQIGRRRARGGLTVLGTILLSNRSLVIRCSVKGGRLFIGPLLGRAPRSGGLFGCLEDGGCVAVKNMRRVIHSTSGIGLLFRIVRKGRSRYDFRYHATVRGRAV